MALKSESAEPALLRRINERRVLELIQRGGPLSRASLARASGLTSPTVSKVVESLLNRGLVEELDQVKSAVGRPGKLMQMATSSSAVLGVVIDTDTCCVTVTGLDGRVTEERSLRFSTPDDYSILIDRLEERCRMLLSRTPAVPRGSA